MKEYLKSKLNTLTEDQKELYNSMLSNELLQICIPTGAGKGYLMMIDLLNQIISTRKKVFAISSHRLMLNSQHLNDIFDLLSPMIGDIGFIFVGSSKYDSSKFQQNAGFNKALFNKKLAYNEIVTTTTNSKEINEEVHKHLSNNRKVVILTTYHSLNTLKDLTLDTLYCDEAHTLASAEDSSRFQENFDKINFKRCYFLTATPKDCVNETETFLMNNEEVFGERIGLDFRHCIEHGYLTTPIVHIAKPSDYNEDYDYKSIDNMTKFILDSFEAHREIVKKYSSQPDKIEPKILVKCSSVDEMWKLHSKLKMSGVKICAGASKNDESTFLHYIDDKGITSRSQYLEELQGFRDDEMAIVLHFDTMSEGINVAGFTGVMFLGGRLPTITKTLQNTGRATRLHSEDRARFRKGEIAVGDGNWIKPYCSVIIPYFDKESEFTAKELAKQIKALRDQFGFDPTYKVSIGTDVGTGTLAVDLPALNKGDEKDEKYDLIEEITHEIELLIKEEEDSKEAIRLNSLSKLELLKEKFKI